MTLRSIEGTPPPHDMDAEGAVLAACLVDKAAYDVAATHVAADDFYAERHARIFRSMGELHAVGEPIDRVTVASKLKTRGELESVGGSEYMGELIWSSPQVARVDRYATRVRELGRMRRMIAAAQRLAAEGYFLNEEPQEYFDRVEAEIHALARPAVMVKPKTIGEAALAFATALGRAMVEGKDLMGASTGFPGLDKLILGLRGSKLHILAARPSVGKSSMALNVAIHMARHANGHVGFFSCEMAAEELGVRALSDEAHIDASKMIQAVVTSAEVERLGVAAAALMGVPVHIFDNPSASTFYIRAESRKLQADAERQGSTLGLIVVDYLQLVDGIRQPGESRQEEVAKIALELKRLSGELNVPVLALSQLNRAVESRGGDSSKPRLSDLRESGAIENHADVVILLHREKRRTLGTARFEVAHEAIVAKARGGQCGIIPLHFKAEHTRFTEVATTQWDQASESDDELR